MPARPGPKQTIPTRLVSGSDNQIEKFIPLWGVRLGTPGHPKKKSCRGSKHTTYRTNAQPPVPALHAPTSPPSSVRSQQHEHVSPGLTETTTMAPRSYSPSGATAYYGFTAASEAHSHYTPHARQSTADSVSWAQPYFTATQATSRWHFGHAVAPHVAEAADNTRGPSHELYPFTCDASHAHAQELPQEHWQHQPPSHPGHGYALAHSQPVPEEAYVSPAQYRSLGIFRADRVSPSLTNGGESVAPLFAADPQKTSDETFPIPLHDYHAYAM